jgi:hypothetical protein
MTLTHDEMIAILEEIARETSNAAARIAAIKSLRKIEESARKPAEGFAELDELTQRRTDRT